ncbi:MAG: hypothetical protein EOP54_27020 [Sphingobacteriales bacterium]|nr:MAG: hypothetical protein EOP54_27020 [Sphingobacteriales bacterium]
MTYDEFRTTTIYEESLKFNLSSVWLTTPNKFVYGFIGAKYQRIKVKFISIKKDTTDPSVYYISGKSVVKNNIADFTGSIKIKKILKRNHPSPDQDVVYYEYTKRGVKTFYEISGAYTFSENRALKHSGIFNGTFKTSFFIDTKGRVKYDDLELNADSYSNNEFIGTWVHYNGKLVQQCNWGDYRIPASGDLDIGAGEFSPNDKYLPMGWQSVRDMHRNDETGRLAKKQEEKEWWK